MKNILIIVIFSFFLNINVNANTTLKWNKTYSGGEVIKINEIKFELPEGEWLLISKYGWTVRTIVYSKILFVKKEENKLKELIELSSLNGKGNYIAYVNSFFQDSLFGSDTEDGCRDQTEYYFVKILERSASFNCFITRHEDVKKELNVIGSMGGWGLWKPFNTSWLRKWIRDNDISVPGTMITREHHFYDQRKNFHYAGVSHSINPEFFDGPKTKFRSEDKSEYHKYNIEEHPKVKKYMNNFVKSSAIKHQEFESLMNASNDFRLNFDELNLQNISLKKPDTSNIVNQLKNLKKLLDEGVITKEEFDLAKKKLLN